MKGTQQDFHADEEAVSPVIGVILMVAITVILAAVIGTFVLNLGSSVQTNVQAGANVQFDTGGTNSLTITFTSNQNADYLNATVTSDNDTAYTTDPDGAHGNHENVTKLNGVGSKVTYELQGWSSDLTSSGDVDDASVEARGVDGGNSSVGMADGDKVSVVVNGIKDDQSTVIVSKEKTL